MNAVVSGYKAMIKNQDWAILLESITSDLKDGNVGESVVESVLESMFIVKLKPVTNMQRSRVTLDAREVYALTDKKTSYRIKKGTEVDLIENNPILSVNWHVYKRLLTSYRLKELITKYELERRVHCFEDLKNLSSYAFNRGPKLLGYRMLVGLHLLYGYNFKALEDSQLEYVNNWFNNDFRAKYLGSETKFNRQLEEVANYFFDGRPNAQQPVSAEEFCSNVTLTGTAGSGYDPGGENLTLLVDGQEYKAYNNKYSKSLKLSISNKLNRLLTTIEQKARISVKVEPGDKVRLIVSSDYNTFLMMSYVDMWLDKVLSGSDASTLWQSSADKLKMWTDFSADDGHWRLPIDQSNFDFHIQKEHCLIVDRAILAKAKNMVETLPKNKADTVSVIENLIISKEHMKIYYIDPTTNIRHEISYVSGLPSGWKWTAMIGTLMNIFQKDIAIRQLRELGYSIKDQSRFNAQGDDQWNRWEKKLDALMYWLSMSAMGYVVNPKKNFLSKDHDEYLRVSSDVDSVNGYPARMINKICWLYPGKTEVLPILERMNMIYERWYKIGQRMGDVRNSLIKQIMLEDIQGAKINRQVAESLFGASVLSGGKGSCLFANNELKVINIPGRFTKRVGLIDAEGYESFKKIFGTDQEREMDKWILDAINIKALPISKEIEVAETIQFMYEEEIKEIPFPVVNVGGLLKPTMIEGWTLGTIFGTSEEVMEKVFPTIKTFVKKGNAPKSWIYDYVLGRLSMPLVELEGYSPEVVSMVAGQFMNAMCIAMYNKKRHHNKWLGLGKYFLTRLAEEVYVQFGSKKVIV